MAVFQVRFVCLFKSQILFPPWHTWTLKSSPSQPEKGQAELEHITTLFAALFSCPPCRTGNEPQDLMPGGWTDQTICFSKRPKELLRGLLNNMLKQQKGIS